MFIVAAINFAHTHTLTTFDSGATDARYSKFNWRPKHVKPLLMMPLGVKRVRQLRRIDESNVVRSAGVDAFVYVLANTTPIAKKVTN